ncbi:MAG: rhodanese-like domain-containing protein [Flavobacterium sp.]
MKKLLLLLLIAVSAIANAQQRQKVELVAPAVFEKKMTAQKGQVIDVRTPKEFQSGHIAGAVNLHVYDKDFEQRVDKLDKNKPVYVYCKAGGRSAEATETLKSKGFKTIVELDGGMDAWTEAGKPVKK